VIFSLHPAAPSAQAMRSSALNPFLAFTLLACALTACDDSSTGGAGPAAIPASPAAGFQVQGETDPSNLPLTFTVRGGAQAVSETTGEETTDPL